MLLPGYAGTYSVPLSTITFPSLTRLTYASDHKYVTLKIGTPEALEGELRIVLIWQILGNFQVNSKNSVFQCIVHLPLAISIKAFRRMLPNWALPVSSVKLILKHLLLSLNFLHTEAKVKHTGESSTIQEWTQAFHSLGLLIAVPM